MADSKPVMSMKKVARELQSKFLESISNEMYGASKTSKNRKVPWGFVSKLFNEAKSEEPWETRNIISFAYKKFISKKSLENEELDLNNTTINNSTNSDGRPKGTSIVNKHHQNETLTAAKNKITFVYQKEKESCKKNGEKLLKGWF